MKRIVLITVVLLTLGSLILPSMVAQAHNAGHIILPSGECVNVGSFTESPSVPEANPNRNDIEGSADYGQLDLIPGPGDQYGARFAAEQGKSAVLPGGCP